MQTTGKKPERRKKVRFPMHHELRYKLLEKDTIVAYGSGTTIDMGSGGIAFTATHVLTLGAFIELSISWPVLLDGHTPMRLVIYGQVLRSDGQTAACTVTKYEFRTQARAINTHPARHNDSIFQRWVDNYRKEMMRTRATA